MVVNRMELVRDMVYAGRGPLAFPVLLPLPLSLPLSLPYPSPSPLPLPGVAQGLGKFHGGALLREQRCMTPYLPPRTWCSWAAMVVAENWRVWWVCMVGEMDRRIDGAWCRRGVVRPSAICRDMASPSVWSTTARAAAAAAAPYEPHLAASRPNPPPTHRSASGAPAMPPLHPRIPHANRGSFDAPRVVPSLPATLRSFTASAAHRPPR